MHISRVASKFSHNKFIAVLTYIGYSPTFRNEIKRGLGVSNNMLWKFSIIFFYYLQSSVQLLSQFLIPLSVSVKAYISLQKYSQISSLFISVKPKQLPTTLLRTAPYLQIGLVPGINDFLFKKSCYLSLKLCSQILFGTCPSLKNEWAPK